jgi:acyl dehydratase
VTPAANTDSLVAAGETLARTLRFSREEIAGFARLSHDHNPLHHDPREAQRAGFPDVIASGQQTAALLMGMLASHFSRSDDGLQREMLCLNMNFAFKGPVLAGHDVQLEWRVASVVWNNKLDGQIAQLDGSVALVGAEPAVVARGTILVKELAP